MSGPIVRTGATPEFWTNWDKVFGGRKKVKTSAATPAKPAKAAKSKPAGPPKKATKKK